MPKKQPKICRTCKSYNPSKKYPGYKAGRCAKGTDFIAISGIFDVKEADSCKKWGTKK